ncbi:hypothetical protein BD410DRAFT_718354 [Rickenella mellea]|uniref:Mitochondrial distribution and morphology protein 12 n=1 Tax=Rickenella mellea TaxID=50990 RepID=A0A4Y7QC11_9AGAM|nr:hypothetical protein BD410DRAFT_718354 [Rickenella mellea]
MSVELEWEKLSGSLATKLVELLNNHLSTVERPSFIGPVEITSFDFGTTCPDVEVVDMRDIYRDFLEDDDEDEDPEPVKVTEGSEDDEGFEWVSRRATGKAMAAESPTYHHFPPHLRYGQATPSDFFTNAPGLISQRDIWNPATSLPNLADMRRGGGDAHEPQVTASVPNNHPNLQLHLHILHHSDLRLTITTSLLINYPSPMFMSLPIKLSVIGLVFNGEVVVAYEGERRRVHFCILDDLDPYGPAGDRTKRESASATPPDTEDEPSVRPAKPLPVGQRLLPSIFIESEIGQADKHVLKNVTRVERFIQDVIRKTVEDELVFPNFHTLILGE